MKPQLKILSRKSHVDSYVFAMCLQKVAWGCYKGEKLQAGIDVRRFFSLIRNSSEKLHQSKPHEESLGVLGVNSKQIRKNLECFHIQNFPQRPMCWRLFPTWCYWEVAEFSKWWSLAGGLWVTEMCLQWVVSSPSSFFCFLVMTQFYSATVCYYLGPLGR